MSPQGRHIELGIAESNLFLQLAALGLAGPLFGTRLLPIGTLYDPFIKRGQDALNYACYQDARFILVATPSGITLAPEGGAHQSVGEPLIGLAQPGLARFDPAYADALAILLRWAFEEIQREAGESVYFRLSTRPIEQPQRTIDPDLAEAIVAGAYWLGEPGPGAELGLPTAVPLPPRRSPPTRRLPRTSPERRAGNLSDAGLPAKISREPGTASPSLSLEDTSPPWSAGAARPECGHCWRRPRDSEPPGHAAHPEPMCRAAENHSRNPS